MDFAAPFEISRSMERRHPDGCLRTAAFTDVIFSGRDLSLVAQAAWALGNRFGPKWTFAE
jgi:hypothetical protein